MTQEGVWVINDKKEAKLLRKKVADFDFEKSSKKETAELVKKMREIMEKSNGIGLSANQIGLDLNVFVAKFDRKFYSVFNPKIVKVSKEYSELEEGCLSVPEIFGAVSRPEKAVLEGFDKNGKPLKIKAWGMLARIFQHEMDHLKGTVFIDKAKELHRYITDNKQLTANN